MFQESNWYITNSYRLEVYGCGSGPNLDPNKFGSHKTYIFKNLVLIETFDKFVTVAFVLRFP